MKESLLALVLVIAPVIAFAVEVTDEDIISEDGATLEKTLEDEEVATQKFTQLVKSTMDLMGPSTQESASLSTDNSSVTP